jgi:hypothetical protein
VDARVTADTAELDFLQSAAAVRERAHEMLARGLGGELRCFHVDLDRLEEAVERTITVTRATYPSLDIPFHARWRHFAVDGEDRWAKLAAATQWRDTAARARAEFDLACISVLLDAGAGPAWRYHDKRSGRAIGRSEGLAIASLDLFAAGAFASRPGDRLRADAAALGRLDAAALAAGFKAGEQNPLVGLDGRAELLRRLGEAVAQKPDVFARDDAPRPGGLFDHLAALAHDGPLPAPVILRELLRHLGGIWPNGLTVDGVALGDCWRYPAGAGDRLVPLHKLSQWLAYSLIEPLQRAGITVVDIDGLTGLAEYRNGGLFVDTGVLVLRERADAARAHEVSSPLVVEWRALTVALLDQLAERMRARLGLDRKSLPLAKVLEGGTWAAGRAIAREKRADGAPPLRVISDGSVF